MDYRPASRIYRTPIATIHSFFTCGPITWTVVYIDHDTDGFINWI